MGRILTYFVSKAIAFTILAPFAPSLSFAETMACVQLFDSSSIEGGHQEYALSKEELKTEFKLSKTNWFLAPELASPQPARAIVDHRMQTVFDYERQRLATLPSQEIRSRYGEMGGHLESFTERTESTRPEHAKPAWSETGARIFEFLPNSVPSARSDSLPWNGRVYLAAGNLVLREPSFADQNIDAKVFHFDGTRLTRVQSFAEFYTERLPFEQVTLIRSMGYREYMLWYMHDWDGLYAESAKRAAAGQLLGNFQLPGVHLAVETVFGYMAPTDWQIKVTVPKSKLVEMARRGLIYVGTHRTLNETFFHSDGWRELFEIWTQSTPRYDPDRARNRSTGS